MSRRFLIAPDKFKGSMDAATAARAIEAGIRSVLPDAEFRILPLADGGEGTAAIFIAEGRGSRRTATVQDALGRPVEASWVLLNDGRGAVLEMAAAAGIAPLRPEERNPLTATTFGVGQLILAALDAGAEELWIGLGGSATNDGGAGLAAALGWRFLDASGEPFLPLPADLHRLAKIEPPARPRRFRCVALADVTNPLLGPNGATAIFGPQKGATAETLPVLEAALTRLAEATAACLAHDHQSTPGAGAAGGTGFGLLAFCNAKIRSGFEVIADLCRIPEAVAWSDWVLTGEGSLDSQSISGKGPVGLARLARQAGRHAAAFAGRVEPTPALDAEFHHIQAITPPGTPLDTALREAPQRLQAAAAHFARTVAAKPA